MGPPDSKKLKLFGIWLGKFYLCKPCAAANRGGSPEFNDKTKLGSILKTFITFQILRSNM